MSHSIVSQSLARRFEKKIIFTIFESIAKTIKVDYLTICVCYEKERMGTKSKCGKYVP
jgi:hypothetical protein